MVKLLASIAKVANTEYKVEIKKKEEYSMNIRICGKIPCMLDGVLWQAKSS